MRLEQLEYLVAISKSTSLNEASKRLYVSQQSLGKAIKNLEDELHTALVVRTHNGCHLTREGFEVLENARDILRQVEDMKSRYNVCPEAEGDLVIICCPSVHETILPEVIDAFSAQLPHIKVTTIRKDSLLVPELHRRLENCGSETIVSLAAIPTTYAPLKERITEAQLQFHPIIDDYWVACMSKQNKLARAANLALRDLLNEPLIIEYPDYPEYGIDRAVLDSYNNNNAVNIQKTVDNEHLMYTAISTNNYIGFASNFYATHSKHMHRYPQVAFRVFMPTIYAKIGLLVSPAQATNPLVKTFTTCLEDTIRTAERNTLQIPIVPDNTSKPNVVKDDFFALPLQA